MCIYINRLETIFRPNFRTENDSLEINKILICKIHKKIKSRSQKTSSGQYRASQTIEAKYLQQFAVLLTRGRIFIFTGLCSVDGHVRVSATI